MGTKTAKRTVYGLRSVQRREELAESPAGQLYEGMGALRIK
jgi:hypothetical protein